MAQLNISQRQPKDGSDVTIVDMEGDILFGDGNLALRAELRRLLGESRKKILLDFSGVRYVDSSGIGEMVSGLTAASRHDAVLKFLNPNERLRELLTITKLLNIFEVFENEAEALASFD
jgi:anti-sigma B factor antagonist